jgi:hypothetical protein
MKSNPDDDNPLTLALLHLETVKNGAIYED